MFIMQVRMMASTVVADCPSIQSATAAGLAPQFGWRVLPHDDVPAVQTCSRESAPPRSGSPTAAGTQSASPGTLASSQTCVRTCVKRYCLRHAQMCGSSVMVTCTPPQRTDNRAVGPGASRHSRMVGQRALDSPADAGAHRHARCQCAGVGFCSEGGLLCKSIVPCMTHWNQVTGAT